MKFFRVLQLNMLTWKGTDLDHLPYGSGNKIHAMFWKGLQRELLWEQLKHIPLLWIEHQSPKYSSSYCQDI